MRSASQRRRHTLYGLAASLVVAGLALVVLWRFPPELYGFYPRCPVHEYLHLECPGCGTTRAISALLHGDPAAALRCNALAILFVLPLAAGYCAVALRRALAATPFQWPVVPVPAVYAAVAVVAVFTVVRNLG